MASTQTLRGQFTHPFIRGFYTSGTRYGRPLCDYSSGPRVVWLAGGTRYPGGRISLKVHPAMVDPFVGLASVLLHHGYAFEESAGGTLSCRNITGARQDRIDRQVREQKAYATSLHAHGLAFDINPSRNRYRRQVGPIQWGLQTDIPRAVIDDVYRIKTKAGKRVLEWGGFFTNVKDAMHFQLDITRADLDVGVDLTTIVGLEAYYDFVGGAPAPIPPPSTEEELMLKRGDSGVAVAEYQSALIDLDYDLGTWDPLPGYPVGADGDFGETTESVVIIFRSKVGQPGNTIDGIIGDLITKAAREATGGGGGGDGYTKNEADVRFAAIAHPHTATTTVK